MKRPKISIVLPSLNSARFIGDALDSIYSQNYPNLEVIVMDGVSTDGTLDILKEYEKKHGLIWRSQKDGDPMEADNNGMKLATGEIIGFQSASDLYKPGSLETVAAEFEKDPNLVFVGGAADVVSIRREHLFDLDFYKERFYFSLDEITEYNIYPPFGSSFYKRQLILEAGGLNTTWKSCHTYTFLRMFMMALQKNQKILCLPNKLSSLRVQNDHANSDPARKGDSSYRHRREAVIAVSRDFKPMLDSRHLQKLDYAAIRYELRHRLLTMNHAEKVPGLFFKSYLKPNLWVLLDGVSMGAEICSLLWNRVKLKIRHRLAAH